LPPLNLPSHGLELAKRRFQWFNITLPAQRDEKSVGSARSLEPVFGKKPASGEMGKHTLTGDPMPFPPALFRAASNSLADVDYQRPDSAESRSTVRSPLADTWRDLPWTT